MATHKTNSKKPSEAKIQAMRRRNDVIFREYYNTVKEQEKVKAEIETLKQRLKALEVKRKDLSGRYKNSQKQIQTANKKFDTKYERRAAYYKY